MIPSIIQWEGLMIRRTVRAEGVRSRIAALWYICNYLHVHPDNLTVEQVGDVVFEMKGKSDRGEKVPRGLAYTSTRVAIRSFFTLVLRISGEVLAAQGVDAAETKGAGSAATQKVTKHERHLFETTLKATIKERYGPPGRPLGYWELLYDEVLHFCKFMYYTGARKAAAYNITFDDPRNVISPAMWSIHILDKGKGGGKHWDKLLIEYALEDFKAFVARRHKIPLESVSEEFRQREGFIFPLVNKENKGMVECIKKALRAAGNPYFGQSAGKTYPCHIWRHTYAQEMLPATNWNYELTASLGGWDSTAILKKHYGEMGLNVKTNGLRAAMGLDVKVETYQLEW